MNKSIAVGLVAGVALTLVGVALYRLIIADEVNCTKHKYHCIRISVDAGTTDVHVDVPKLRKKGKKHVIWWFLDNDDGQTYVLSDTSIVFTTAGGQAEFPPGSCQRKSDTVFMCTDEQGLKGTGEDKDNGYKYTVTVPAAGKEDPYIYND